MFAKNDKSYVIYFLSVFVEQLTGSYFDWATLNILKERELVIDKDRLPDRLISYCPRYWHLVIMVYCLTYINLGQLLGTIVHYIKFVSRKSLKFGHEMLKTLAKPMLN